VREDLVENEDWSNVKGNTIVPKGKRRISGYDDVKTFNFNWPENDTVTKRLVDVLEETVDEKYYLSDERVKQLKFNDKVQKGDIKQVAQYDTDKRENSNRFRTYEAEGIGPGLSTMGGGGLEPCITVLGSTQKNAAITDGDISPTLTSSMGTGGGHVPMPVFDKGYTVAEPGESVNISFPDSETRRGRVGKQTANTLLTGEEQAVVLGGIYTNVSKELQRGPLKGLSSTLKSNKNDAGITDGLRIRKLTPLECWRLQGFTDEQFYKAKNDGVSNSQLYKQAGNSVSVPVIKAIAERLL